MLGAARPRLRVLQVIAFEPNPWSFEVLKLNARMNPGLNIHPHNFAAGDGQSSELLFTYGGDMCNGGHYVFSCDCSSLDGPGWAVGQLCASMYALS